MPQPIPQDGETDLSNCDREPIHLLGAIQPIGFLFSVSADWIVVRASENVHSYLGVPHDRIVAQPVETYVSADVLHDIRGRLQLAAGVGIVERLFRKRLAPDGALFDVAVHQSGREIVLEFEPSSEETSTALSILRTMIARVERQRPSRALYSEAARQVRALTGFDRVMMYRFDEDGAGEVVAETAKIGLPQFLGLRYPASDIPEQARALYERNFLRIIVDVDADPVPVTPALSPEGQALDLSMSVLRSVSPIHIEYLRNMGVRSSMSISILEKGKLWGLIACHHGAPKHVGFVVRSTAELFGQIFSYLLEVHQREDDARYDAHTRDIHNRIASAFAEPDASLEDVPKFLAGIDDYVSADGIGLYNSGKISLTGVTPTREEFLELVRFLNTTASGRLFATHCLSEIFPRARDYVMRAAGILSIPISRTPRDYLVFFRREIVKSVIWAGEPTTVKSLGPHGVRLTPRKSFEAWREIVQNQSERWTDRELRAAEALRVTLVELVLRMSEATNADRLALQQRQEILIAELNHRVRNILGLVRGLITQSAASAGDLRVLVDNLDDRIRSLARAHDLLTSSNWRAVSLHALLHTEIEAYSQLAGRVILVGQDVLLQPKAFSAMALVVHELVTNARKYGALSRPSGQITVEITVDEISNVAVSWRETGGPTVAAPTRRGLGSVILEQVIPFEVNGASRLKFLPEGFGIDLILPAAVAQCIERPAANAPPAENDTIDETGLAGLLRASLVVEDNLFIAIDAEDMLHKLGAGTVDVARSVSEALAALAERSFSFALLDVNLGSETSLPVAKTLQASNVPFAFATGYGENIKMPNTLADVPIISKPYHRAPMVKGLMQLLRGPEAASAVARDPGRVR